MSDCWVLLPYERVEGRTWTIYVCAEPDGQDCASGTHPNILSHKCKAIRDWHEWCAAHDWSTLDEEEDRPRGPKMAAVEVVAVLPA